MKTYARIQDGVVAEIIPPAAYDAESPEWTEGAPSRVGEEIPIELRFTAELVETMYDVTDLEPMPRQGWTFDGTTYAAPVAYQPSPEEIFAANKAEQESLAAYASLAMTPLFLSIQLGDATDDETIKAKAWQAYYRVLKTVDLTVENPKWPALP